MSSATAARNAPRRLEPLEEAILIVTTGLTGVVMHDGPLKKPSGAPEDLGTMFCQRAGALRRKSRQLPGHVAVHDQR